MSLGCRAVRFADTDSDRRKQLLCRQAEAVILVARICGRRVGCAQRFPGSSSAGRFSAGRDARISREAAALLAARMSEAGSKRHANIGCSWLSEKQDRACCHSAPT